MKTMQELMKTHLNQFTSPYCRTEMLILEDYLNAAVANGFTIQSVWDGEERNLISNNDVIETIDHIYGVDESSLCMSKKGIGVVQYMVIGEEEAQTITDEGSDDPSLLEELEGYWKTAVQKIAPELYQENFA